MENYSNKVTAVIVIQCCLIGVVKYYERDRKMSRQLVTVTIRQQPVYVPTNCRARLNPLQSCLSKSQSCYPVILREFQADEHILITLDS